MAATHRQVPVLDFEVDEDIAELIALMNACEIETIMSCQDNDGRRGTARRVRVEVYAEDLMTLLGMLDRPGEAGDVESLSHRMAGLVDADDWEAFREDRAWRYVANVGRYEDGELEPLTISIRFPYTDLDEVVARPWQEPRSRQAPLSRAA